MTTTIQQPSPSRHPRWDAFKRSFTQSNYITDFWNWLMTLMSKAAELVLFGSVLYSGYQLLPNITHAPAQVDALVFVIQQAALDIGGMGLLKLARRAGLPKDAFPVRVGITLVLLMILNVVLASLKQALPVIPAAVFVWIETVLLIARAVMAVLFGHAIHALREEYSESTVTVKEANELQQRLEALSSEFTRIHNSFHFQLSSLRETFQRSQDALAQIPEMKARLHHLESSTVEELRRVKSSLEQQRQSRFAASVQREERGVLHVLPSLQQGKNQAGTPHAKEVRAVAACSPTQEKFDTRAFVFACLQENPDLKLAEIEQRALAAGQELSQPTASRYRKQYFASRESSAESSHESSAMKAQAIDESSTMKAESGYESSADDERRAVGK